MVVSAKKLVLPILIAAAVTAGGILFFSGILRGDTKPAFFMGGAVHIAAVNPSDYTNAVNVDGDAGAERFQRPSKDKALENNYTFTDFMNDRTEPPFVTTVFNSPQDVIKAYFAMIENAENLDDYKGGCGTVGDAKGPFPYAYELFTVERQKKMSRQDFINSYRGIGHTTLLKLYPAYTPENTPPNIRYYMFETESITGPWAKDKNAFQRDGGYFTYHYGLITAEYDKDKGWKIQSIDYLPEDFLCAPMHGWAYDANSLVEVVYHDWYKLIDRIDKTDQQGNMIYVYASNSKTKGQYRLDFVRLTNGYDILLHENILKDGKWQETDILRSDDQRLKLSILNPELKG